MGSTARWFPPSGIIQRDGCPAVRSKCVIIYLSIPSPIPSVYGICMVVYLPTRNPTLTLKINRMQANIPQIKWSVLGL